MKPWTTYKIEVPLSMLFLLLASQLYITLFFSCIVHEEILGFCHLVPLISLFKFTSNVKFITCVDPFHEVKSKREKKKEVRAFGILYSQNLFDSLLCGLLDIFFSFAYM